MNIPIVSWSYAVVKAGSLTDLTGSRNAPDISTLPSDVAFFAVEKTVPLFQKLPQKKYFYWQQLLVDVTFYFLKKNVGFS